MENRITKVKMPSADDSMLIGENIDNYPRHHFFHAIWENEAERWPVQAIYGGDGDNIGGIWRARRNSDTCSLELVTSGCFEFEQNGRCCTSGPGDLFIVQFATDSRMACTAPHARKRTIALGGGALQPVFDTLNLSEINLFRQVPFERFDALFGQMFELLKCRDPHKADAASLLTCEILLELSHLVPENREGSTDLLLDFIVKNLHRPLSVGLLCRTANVGPRQLYAFFRAMGTTPAEYIISQRMKRARTLLLDRKLLIKEVARRAGYADPLYFSAEFRRLHGVSPREFRRRHTS
ncbi:MAG: helix-turn-helix transcriptional regulator [Lentisphaeria bacterium]|nr:helix-turn-helix transcriptional regulator [Lentisphaeria bacterium]